MLKSTFFTCNQNVPSSLFANKVYYKHGIIIFFSIIYLALSLLFIKETLCKKCKM